MTRPLISWIRRAPHIDPIPLNKGNNAPGLRAGGMDLRSQAPAALPSRTSWAAQAPVSMADTLGMRRSASLGRLLTRPMSPGSVLPSANEPWNPSQTLVPVADMPAMRRSASLERPLAAAAALHRSTSVRRPMPAAVSISSDARLKAIEPGEKYRSRAAFEAAIRDLAHEHATYEEVAAGVCYGSDDIARLENAWHAYQGAQYADPIVVLGRNYDYRHRLIEDFPWIDSCDESFPCVDKKLVDNIGMANESVPVESTGGTLYFNRWSCAVNDAWILGLIHHGRDIYFASPRTEANIRGHSDRRALTATGRELIGLEACGRYQFVTASPSGEVIGEAVRFRHSHETRAFGFAEYLASIRRYLRDPALFERLWTSEPEPLAGPPVN